jgi:hypothetical protein
MSEPGTQMRSEEPGNRPDVADRDTTPEQEQLAQADRNDVDLEADGDARVEPGRSTATGTSSATAGGDTDVSPAADRVRPEGDAAGEWAADPQPTPRGYDTDAQSVPEPFQPVPGVEDGTRSRHIAGTDGDNELPPVSDIGHGGDIPPREPPD